MYWSCNVTIVIAAHYRRLCSGILKRSLLASVCMTLLTDCLIDLVLPLIFSVGILGYKLISLSFQYISLFLENVISSMVFRLYNVNCVNVSQFLIFVCCWIRNCSDFQF